MCIQRQMQNYMLAECKDHNDNDDDDDDNNTDSNYNNECNNDIHKSRVQNSPWLEDTRTLK